jgi:integrase
MGVGRKRTTNKHLPLRVYVRNGTYWFFAPDKKWHKLGRTEQEMYRSLAQLKGQNGNSLAIQFNRYEREILPKKAASTQKGQKKQLQNLHKSFGKMRPESLTTRHVARFLRGYPAPIQANRHIALLSDIYSTMISWWMVDGVLVNPCIGVKRNPETPRTRYVEDQEFWTVWNEAPAHIQILMELAFLTGLRQGKLLALKHSDCLQDGVHAEAGKGGKKLIFEWTPALRDAVNRSRKGTANVDRWLIRQKNGQRITQDGIKTAWQRLMVDCFKSGLIKERFTFHDIRAKSATDHESGKHLGHQSQKTLEKFYRRKPTVVRGL